MQISLPTIKNDGILNQSSLNSNSEAYSYPTITADPQKSKKNSFYNNKEFFNEPSHNYRLFQFYSKSSNTEDTDKNFFQRLDDVNAGIDANNIKRQVTHHNDFFIERITDRDLNLNNFNENNIHRTIDYRNIGHWFHQKDSQLHDLREMKDVYQNIDSIFGTIKDEIINDGILPLINRGKIPDYVDLNGIMTEKLNLTNQDYVLKPTTIINLKKLNFYFEVKEKNAKKTNAETNKNRYQLYQDGLNESFFSKIEFDLKNKKLNLKLSQYQNLKPPNFVTLKLKKKYISKCHSNVCSEAELNLRNHSREEYEYILIIAFKGVIQITPSYNYFLKLNMEYFTEISAIFFELSQYLIIYSVEFAEIRCDAILRWAKSLDSINLKKIDFKECIFNEIERYEQIYLKKYLKYKEEIKENFKKFTEGKRVIIQFDYTPQTFNDDIVPDINFGRCLFLQDPLVDLIIVTPSLIEDKREFYKEIIKNNNLENYMERIHFVAPETWKNYKLPETLDSTSAMRLTHMLLTSTRALKWIKNFIKGKEAVIWVDQITKTEVAVSGILGIPILGPTIFDYYSNNKKSSVKKFFTDAGVNFAPGMVINRDSGANLSIQIYNLVQQNKEMCLWNICNEDNTINDRDLYEGRTLLSHFNLDIIVPNEYGTDLKEDSKIALFKILSECGFFEGNLFSPLRKNFLYLQGVPKLLGDEMNFIEIVLMVDSKGGFEILLTLEKLKDKKFKNVGKIAPQSKFNNEDLQVIIKKIANTCPIYGIVGLISLDLVTWTDKNDYFQYHFTELNMRPTANVIRIFSTMITTGLRYEMNCNEFAFYKDDIPTKIEHLRSVQHSSLIQARFDFESKLLGYIKPRESRIIYYSENQSHSHIKIISRKTLFALNKLNSVKFDLWARLGSFVPFSDIVCDTSIPVVCIGENIKSALERYIKDLVKIYRQVDVSYVESTSNFKHLCERVMQYISDYIGTVVPITTNLESINDFEDYAAQYYTVARSQPKSARKLSSHPQDKNVMLTHTTTNILNTLIASQLVASIDPTFRRPAISPPYSRPQKQKHVTDDNASKRTLEIMKEIEEKVTDEESKKPKEKNALMSWREELDIWQVRSNHADKMKHLFEKLETMSKRRSALVENIEDVLKKAEVMITTQREKRKELFPTDIQEIASTPVKSKRSKSEKLGHIDNAIALALLSEKKERVKTALGDMMTELL
ncbi:hypothetical protein HK099_000441 [Clydaea vesicula]|uniref:IQCH-like ATP-grasp domain-containing protein n=1 Tax=Clydaea vesicula TaxID=447962 RepID=A0AAD5U7P5_9FUNG|nr:hypothetical protein HK099_000441 [Clydaea vesicula]